MFINKINGIASNIGFKGYQHTINDVGETILKFNYPYDYKDGETCEILIYQVKKTDKFNFKIDESKPIKKVILKPEGTEVNLQKDTNLDKDEAFAYKVVRKNKNGEIIWSGADTGVKMRKDKNNEYVFRVCQDKLPYYDNTCNRYNDDGSIVTDKDGEPEIDHFYFETDTDFKFDSINNYKYTLVTRNGTTPLVQGPGYLAMPDTLWPGMRYKGFDEEGTGELIYDSDYQRKMEGMVKTISNMYGGSIAGLEAMVPTLKEIGIKKFFTTPLANGDDRTSHGYYNKNNFQVPDNMGTSENYDSLMVAEFKNGMSHVFDATLTSEGIEGIHVRYALRWGDKAQTAKWFRLGGLKDTGIGFGVVPNEAQNLRHRIINSPYKYELQSNGTYKKVVNNDYKPNQETLLQIYDASQVSDEQLNNLDKPIDMYRELNAGRDLNITTYDDTTISYVFEINPNEYDKNINKINDLIKKEGKKIELNSPEGTIMASNMSNFSINKTSNGYVAWDDNPDMVKMNYGISAYDEKELQGIVDRAERQHQQDLRVIASKEVQDIGVQVGKYWAERTKRAHSIYLIQTLGKAKSAEQIDKLIAEGKLPEEVRLTQNAINNILNGEYNLSPKGKLSKDDVTVRALMNLPLDSIKLGENTTGVLSTSYFSNRATTDETIGLSRFELMKQNNPHLLNTYENVYNKMNDIYMNELKEFANNIIKIVNEVSDEPLINSDGTYTEYGEYVIDLLGSNITNYAILKSLAGESFKYKILPKGTLTYDYKNIKQATTLKALGINASNPSEEAELLLKKIKNGLKTLTIDDEHNVARAIALTINGTDTNTFRMNEAMLDKAGLELDFRLDASKDVMDIDAVRNRDADFDDTWTNLIKFWSKYVQGVKSVNPHSFIAAEITDVADVMKDSLGGGETCPYNGWSVLDKFKYYGEPDAIIKFFNETGITTEAAYSYFFTELLTSFSKEFEKGTGISDTHDGFVHKYNLLINTKSADYLRNLYTFMGNHDKARTVHGLAIDMELFHSTLTKIKEHHNKRLDVIRVLSGARTQEEVPLELRLNVDNLDYFRTVSSRAVAQTKLLMDSADQDLAGIASDEDIKLLKEALIDITNGNYLQSKESEKMTKIKLAELSSLDNAVKEVARLANNKGISLSETEINNIISKAKTLNTDDYLAYGDFDWTDDNIGETNKKYLAEILGNDDNAMSYSIYSLQIARMIKEAAKDTPAASKISDALKDFVTLYNREKISQNMDSLKMFEDFTTARKKNSYAAQDFRVALEEAFAQAEFKSGRKIANQEEIIAKIYNSVTEPALKKHAMIMSFLGAFCGIPTTFAGDEYGDAGYEDKAKNPNVRNRMASRRSEIERNTTMGKIMNRNKDIMYDAIKHKANVKPLQNGTPYSMDVMINGLNRLELQKRIAEIEEIRRHLTPGSAFDKELEKEYNVLRLGLAKAAFMMQNADGDIAISVLNAAGIYHDNRVNYFDKLGLKTKEEREKFFRDNNIDPINPDNPYIPIQEKTYMDAILMGAGVTVPLGTIFVNADARDKAKYIVKKIQDRICIVREDGKKIVMDGITAKNGAMILRKVAFRGRTSGSGIYNQQYNLVTNPYTKNEKVEFGKNLSLVAR